MEGTTELTGRQRGGRKQLLGVLIGAIPLCCNNILIFYYRPKTQHMYKKFDNISKFWQTVSAVKSHHRAKIEQSVGTMEVCTPWYPIAFALLVH
jgi:hypothetical protein